MGFLKKLGKKLKSSIRDIATVVGFALGGPAGAAIGQGLGSLAEGRSFKKSVGSSVTVFAGGNLLGGAGIPGGNPAGNFFQNTGRIQLGAPMGAEQISGGLSGVFEGAGADLRNFLTTGRVSESLASDAFKNLNRVEQGILASGLLGAEELVEEPTTGRFQTPNYFTSRLGASQSGDGGLQGAISPFPSGGVPSTGMVDSGLAMTDPLQAIILDELLRREQQLSHLPQFDVVTPVKDGCIVRLADGGQLPELDLREHGGDIKDPMGSGDKDTVPALLADGEFVMTKQAVKGIGDGDHSKGISNLYAMMNKNEKKAQSMGLSKA